MEPIRKFQHKDIVGIIQDLEFIRINLTRIGKLSTANDKDLEKVLLIQSLFLADIGVQNKFSRVWRLLVDNYKGDEAEDLDDQLDTIDHWEIPNHLEIEELLKIWKSKGQVSVVQH